MLQRQIDSSLVELDRLAIGYPWLPNSQTCRPDHQTLVEKKALLNISSQADITRWIFEGSYGWVFKPTKFRYNLPDCTAHWILWNTDYSMDWKPNSQEVTEVIFTLLYEHLGSDKFDFAWYINPKPTVTQFFHVQVFWICLNSQQQTNLLGQMLN